MNRSSLQPLFPSVLRSGSNHKLNGRRNNDLFSFSLQGAQFTDRKTDCRLKNPCFENLENLDLRFLHGDNSKVFSSILPHLADIRCLGIDRVDSSVELERIFSALNNLTIVHCQNCTVLTDAHVTTLANSCPKLESLCLTGCIYVTGSSFPVLLSQCRQLKTLLVSCTRIRDVYLMLTNWAQSSLTELDISYCYGISSSALLEMLPKLDRLRYLQISFCGWGRALTNDVVNAMSYTEYKHLDTLDLHSSFNITGDTLCNLLRNCPALKTLCVGGAITSNDELEALLRIVKSLKHFYITKQPTIKTETVFGYVKNFCPRIETLALYNFYASNRIRVEEALIELVVACKYLKVLCIRGTNVPLRAELTELANRVKKVSKRNDIEISRRPHFLVSEATLCMDRVIKCSNFLR